IMRFIVTALIMLVLVGFIVAFFITGYLSLNNVNMSNIVTLILMLVIGLLVQGLVVEFANKKGYERIIPGIIGILPLVIMALINLFLGLPKLGFIAASSVNIVSFFILGALCMV